MSHIDHDQKFFWLKNLSIKTVIDVGANEGQFLEKYLPLFPNATVYCFEPLKGAFAILKEKFHSRDRFIFYNCALGDENASVVMHCNDYSPSSSLLQMNALHKDVFSFTAKDHEELIEVKVADEVMRSTDVYGRTLLKIDVQGFELRVLRGARALLEKVDVIIVETSFFQLYTDEAFFDDVYTFLVGAGFRYVGSFDQLTRPQDGLTLQQDAIFIKQSVHLDEDNRFAFVSTCPLCGENQRVSLGQIMQTADKEYAGTHLGVDFVSELFECAVCSSKFVSPRVSKDYAETLYRESPATRWVTESESELLTKDLFRQYTPENFQKIFEKHIVGSGAAGRRVLDIGCFHGKLLDLCKIYGFETYGVEPNKDAVAHARKKHNVILGNVEAALEFSEKFDVIVAFDVFEHLYDVDTFWRVIDAKLTDGGTCIVLTGNPHDAWAERDKSAWWYAQFPEHIIFPSIRYFQRIAPEKNLHLQSVYVVKNREDFPIDRRDHNVLIFSRISRDKSAQKNSALSVRPHGVETIACELSNATAPLVTVITVTFNLIDSGREDFFRKNIESVHNQTYQNIEHLIIDGASKDGTLGLLKEYAGKGWIRYISEPDSGIYDAMNKGIHHARGKYIVFLNSDDFYHGCDGIALSVQALEESGASFSYAPARIIHKNGRPFMGKHPNCEPNVKRVFFEMPFCHQTMLTKRDILVREGLFDTHFKSAGDYDFLLRICLKDYQSIFVPEIFTSFRLGGFSDTDSQQSLREVGMAYYKNFKNIAPVTEKQCHKIYYNGFYGISRKLAQSLRKHSLYFDYGAYKKEKRIPCGPFCMRVRRGFQKIMAKVRFAINEPDAFLRKYTHKVLQSPLRQPARKIFYDLHADWLRDRFLLVWKKYVPAQKMRLFLTAVTTLFYGSIGCALLWGVPIILYNANWILGDDIMFIWSTAIGQPTHMMIGSGRFVALAFQEFNILNILPHGQTPYAHYILVALSFCFFIIGTGFLYHLIIQKHAVTEKKRVAGFVFAAILLFCLLISPSFFEMFMQVIFPERMVLVLLTFFMIFLVLFLTRGGVWFYILTVLAAGIAMYYKEPVGGALLIATATPILFGRAVSVREKAIFAGVFINGIIYAILYYIVIFQHSDSFYNAGRVTADRLHIIISILDRHPLIIGCIAIAIVRMFYIFVKNDRKHLVYDGLLFAAIGYAFAYVLLRLDAQYYFTPVYVIVFPTLLYYCVALRHTTIVLSTMIIILFFAYTHTHAFAALHADIGSIQSRRSLDMMTVNQIATLYKSGETLIWFQREINDPKHLFSNHVMDDRLVKLTTFTQFVLKDPHAKIFVTRDRAVLPLSAHEILFYPKENNYAIPGLGDFFLRQSQQMQDFYNTIVFKR